MNKIAFLKRVRSDFGLSLKEALAWMREYQCITSTTIDKFLQGKAMEQVHEEIKK